MYFAATADVEGRNMRIRIRRRKEDRMRKDYHWKRYINLMQHVR
jgi:hypothetical protein